jgi:thiol:disulfide interchange protein DsbA
MNRREFSAQLIAASVGATASSWLVPAQAQVEGTDYVKLSQPVPVPAGKIEVIEFFWYGCPHCNAFDPSLEKWSQSLPPDVAFRRVHVALAPHWAVHQRIFYALDTMGLEPSLHKKVFAAIHIERQHLDKPADISAFMQKNGVDAAKFMDNFNSFTVQTKCRQAGQLAAAYKIDGVPTMGVQGRYYTSVSMAGSHERTLAIVDQLIQKARKSA